MSFNNTAPLSYAAGEVVKYIDAQRGVAETVGGPKLAIVGLYAPKTNDLYDPDRSSNTTIITTVAANTTAQQLLAANTSRQSFVITNENSSNAILYIAYANTANATYYTYSLYANATLEMAFKYTGPIWGALSSNTGSVRITDFR